MRASRLLAILILLQLRRRLTAGALAREFEVSARTILRDMDELSAAGVPVLADRGPGGGFRLRDDFHTRLTGLLPDEAQALPLLGLPGAAGDLGFGTAPRRLRHKLLAALPGETAALAGRLHDCLHVDPLGWYHDSVPTPQLPALARATLDRRRVLLQYDSWSGRRRWTVEPLGLVLKAGHWYLLARTGTRTMTLKASQVLELTVVEAEAFERPRDFDLAAAWQASLQRFERDLRRQQAVIRVSDEGRRRLAEDGSYAARAIAAAEPEDGDGGWARVTLPVEGDAQALRLLLSLAGEVEVLEPPALRRQMAETAAAIARRHRRGAATVRR